MFDKNLQSLRAAKLLSLLALAAAASACTSIAYRCPLTPGEKPDEATACAGMSDAMQGARKGTGGRVSVLMDDKGRLVPQELLTNGTARPVANQTGPFREPTGAPVFVQPRMFQAYTESFQDGNGNLHDGHHAYFTTPGRWSYGAMDRGTAISSNLMGPTRPSQVPEGRIVPVDPRTGAPLVSSAPAQGARLAAPSAASQAAAVNSAANASQAMSAQQRDRAALQNLSGAASNAAQRAGAQPGAPLTAPTVTAPAVQFGSK